MKYNMKDNFLYKVIDNTHIRILEELKSIFNKMK